MPYPGVLMGDIYLRKKTFLSIKLYFFLIGATFSSIKSMGMGLTTVSILSAAQY